MQEALLKHRPKEYHQDLRFCSIIFSLIPVLMSKNISSRSYHKVYSKATICIPHIFIPLNSSTRTLQSTYKLFSFRVNLCYSLHHLRSLLCFGRYSPCVFLNSSRYYRSAFFVFLDFGFQYDVFCTLCPAPAIDPIAPHAPSLTALVAIDLGLGFV